MPITKRDVEAIEANSVLWDQGRGSVAGFGVRCQKVAKVFILKYARAGRGRWYTIGRFGSPWTVEGARSEAKRLLGIVAEGRDPGMERTNATAAEAPLSMADLCDRYLEVAKAGLILTRFKRPKKATTLADDEGRIHRHIKPLIGTVPASNVDRMMVRRMIADIAAGKTAVDEKTKLRGRAIVTGGQTTAARVADLLSGIMAWAVDENLVAANPVHGVRRYRAEPRQRFLLNIEIQRLGCVIGGRRVGAAGEALHPYALAIIELLALTGCRLGEISNLRWSEVDFQNQCLRLVDTKTGQSMRPVGKIVIERLSARSRQAGSAFVFPAARGEGAYQGTKRQARRIFAAAEIEEASCHTLRHTFGSVASDLGYSDATIAGLLGHAGRGVTSRYVHRPDEALRLAAGAVSNRITTLLGAAGKNKDGLVREGADAITSSVDVQPS